MLAKPKFFDSPSAARAAARLALNACQLACAVNDILSRIDPDEGRWFAIVVLDTDSPATLLQARKRLPEFRVIGEIFPEAHPRAHAPEGSRRGTPPLGERARHLSS